MICSDLRRRMSLRFEKTTICPFSSQGAMSLSVSITINDLRESRTSGSCTQTRKFKTTVVANGYKTSPSLRPCIFRNWSEVVIVGVDRKNRGLWGRECNLSWRAISSLRTIPENQLISTVQAISLHWEKIPQAQQPTSKSSNQHNETCVLIGSNSSGNWLKLFLTTTEWHNCIIRLVTIPHWYYVFNEVKVMGSKNTSWPALANLWPALSVVTVLSLLSYPGLILVWCDQYFLPIATLTWYMDVKGRVTNLFL